MAINLAQHTKALETYFLDNIILIDVGKPGKI